MNLTRSDTWTDTPLGEKLQKQKTSKGRESAHRQCQPIDALPNRPVAQDSAAKDLVRPALIIGGGSSRDEQNGKLIEHTGSIRTFSDSPLKQESIGERLYSLTISGLREHQFICLSQYSMFRAYLQNAHLLRLDFALFADDDSTSPWTTYNPFPELTTPVPHSLNPTNLQLSTFHHPYLDTIASPSLRNNILIATLREDQEEQLCMDLHSNGSITVWGSQPWSSMGWEVSQNFADRWGWILDGETIRCSNFWRMERGEAPLHIQLPVFEQ